MSRILVIDDDDALRASMRKVLERAGYEVMDASDGRQGLSLFAASPADLVITDLIMPEKEGIETIMELRADFPEVKILAVSGGGSIAPTGPLIDAELFGADASLAKPFTIEDLREKVATLIGTA